MSGRRRFAVVIFLVLMLGMSSVWTGRQVVSARPAGQGSFPPGAVVSLSGTPHLWIADAQGTLHWGGDTRALQGRVIDWSTRFEIPLETFKTLQTGDPWLSAGLLKDGIPIYLVKWESSESVPRLLHIQCIQDVELFGINGNNYGNFVMDRNQWEAKFHIPVSTLQRGELEPTDPSLPNCPSPVTPTPAAQRPLITISSSDLARLGPTLAASGLGVDRINVSRTTTFALTSGGSSAPVVLAAPVSTAPGQNVADVRAGASVAMGVLQAQRDLQISGAMLRKDIYLVTVRSGRVVYTNPQGQDTISTRSLDARQLSRRLPRPQTTLTAQDVCFGWNQVQVCGDPGLAAALSSNDRDALQGTMSAARDSLKARGLLDGDISLNVTLSEAEGTAAVNQKQANIVAAPAGNLADVTRSGPPPDGAFIGIIVVVDHMVDVPNYVQIPPGQYAVQSEVGGTQAVLLASDGREGIVVPMRTLVVRGAPSSGQTEQPLTIIANLCFGSGGESDLCLFGEPD